MSGRVVILTEDPNGPSARHRWTYTAPYLRRQGLEPLLLPVEPKSVRAASFAAARDADLVVIHRKLFRLFDFLRLVRMSRKRGVAGDSGAVSSKAKSTLPSTPMSKLLKS